MLDEICRTVGMTRKDVIKLMSGNIEYRERKGRGKTYDGKTPETLKMVWREKSGRSRTGQRPTSIQAGTE